jgi:hypothetical protein
MNSLCTGLCALLLTFTLSPRTIAAEETLSVHDSMERIDEAFKTLRRILRAPDTTQTPDALAALATLKTEAARSRDLVPETLSSLPEAELATALPAYREQMDAFLKTIGELEQAIQAGDWTQAGQLARQMQRQKSEGHERFKGE